MDHRLEPFEFVISKVRVSSISATGSVISKFNSSTATFVLAISVTMPLASTVASYTLSNVREYFTSEDWVI